MNITRKKNGFELVQTIFKMGQFAPPGIAAFHNVSKRQNVGLVKSAILQAQDTHTFWRTNGKKLCPGHKTFTGQFISYFISNTCVVNKKSLVRIDGYIGPF